MSRVLHLPNEPFERFRDIYRALNRNRGMLEGVQALRFAAMAAMTSARTADDVADDIRSHAREMKNRTGWFGDLNSPVRFIVAAILLQSDLNMDEYFAGLESTAELFREERLRRGRIYETMAATILLTRLERVDREVVAKFKAIYEEMKKHHWWLTGPEDFPACAILATRELDARSACDKIESIYQGLNRSKFSKGDALQTASHLLSLADLPVDVLVERYAGLRTSFKRHNVSIWQSDYDELAILSFLNQPGDRVVETTLRIREKVKMLKPKPDINVSFNLAAGIAFFELVSKDESVETVAGAKAMLNMQQIIQAQQAVIAACAANSIAVTTTSSASS